MQTQLKPWTGSERLYFYPQSAQIVGQTAQIGRLRIDFGRQGNEFYSTWEDSRLSLKSDKFRQQFDDVINDLRFGDGNRPLAGRKEMTEFLRDKQAAILPGDGEWHGFQIDSEEYTSLLRCKPSPGDYEAYVWCYKKDWLDEHMANAEKGIRFIDSHYQDKFRIRDGNRIRITFPDGEIQEKQCRYVDDTHFEMDRGIGPFSLFHICQFAEQMERSGAAVAPADQPLAVLHETDDEIRIALVSSMRKWGRRYPDAGYGGRFYHWLRAKNPEPYGSYGNGSAMCVSAAGWLYDTLDETRHVARLTADVTHNHPEGVKGAEATANAIFLSRTGASKDEIRAYIITEFGYDLSRTCNEIRRTYHHSVLFLLVFFLLFRSSDDNHNNDYYNQYDEQPDKDAESERLRAEVAEPAFILFRV